MKRIAIRKADKKIMSFGYEDMRRFSLEEFDIVETPLQNLPDKLEFCKYKNGKIVVDNVLRQETLDAELKAEQDVSEARQEIRLSQLKNKTYAEAVSWIDGITDLASAKQRLKIMCRVLLALVKRLDIK